MLSTGWLIVSIVLAAVALFCYIGYRKEKADGLWWSGLIAISLTGLIILFNVGGNMSDNVPSGNMGVKVFLGAVDNDPISEGFTLKSPFTDVIYMHIKTNALNFTGTNGYWVTLPEGIKMRIDADLTTQLDSTKASIVYRFLGKDWWRKIIPHSYRSACFKAVKGFDPYELYNTRRNEFADSLRVQLFRTIDSTLLPYPGLNHTNFNIQLILSDIGVPDEITDAIRLKYVRKEEAEAMPFVLIRDSLEAERKVIEARGINNYNKLVRKNLTPGVLTMQGYETMKEVAKNPNVTIIMGSDGNGIPVVIPAGAQKTVGTGK